jgi:hypothetical protein
MSRGGTDHALVLWMEGEGEIYSPAMTLGRSSEEAIARDLWECAHAGVCHSVYRYGTHANGGSYCREITQDVATRLGRLSLAMRREPAEPVRAFLKASGIDYFGEEVEPVARDFAAHPPFEMQSPEQGEISRKMPRRKSRSRRLTPEELRAQPQFKLPISGGKDIGASGREGRAAVETDEDTGVERLSLRDERTFAEQAAAWERFDRKMGEMGARREAGPKKALAPDDDKRDASRKSTSCRS